jgi:crotonobetainyl-CoA:carnitine CoA-transferase CaiB-like acyl-CoA transferase
MSVLSGVRVLEASNFVSGPYACQLLAELGAEVIKVENPNGGDPFRNYTPDAYSAAFCAHNRRKKSITLNLSNPAGVEVFQALTRKADVLVENFRPGTMDRLGLGWDRLSTLNPKLIYCSITGFGPDGPYRHRPAYDTVVQALSGLLGQFLEPERPKITGPNVADAVTGLYAAYGVLGALYQREKSGCGHLVEVPMLDAVISFATNSIAQFFRNGVTPSPYQRPAASQCFVLPCADGKLISVHLSTPPKFWEALLQVIGRPELAADTRFDSAGNRIKKYEVLSQELGRSFVKKEQAEWIVALEALDVPFAPVNDFAAVVEDPQVRHLGTIIEMRHPRMGSVKGVNSAVHFDRQRDTNHAPPPMLGEHNDQVLREAGFSSSDIESLRERGALDRGVA